MPPTATARTRFSPGQLELQVGQTGAVSLVVLGAKDLISAELTLRFDATRLEMVEVSPGSLLTLDGVAVGSQTSLEASEVRVRFDRPTPTAGSGAVATLRLKGLAEGVGTVSLVSIRLGTSQGGEAQVVPPGPAQVKVGP